MKDAVTMPMNRRDVLGAAVVGVGALALGGCQNRPRWTRLPAGWNSEPVPRPQPHEPRTMPQPGTGYSGEVMPRRAWTNDGPVMSMVNPMNGVTRITIHHDAMNSTGIRTASDAARRLQQVRKVHLGNDWADIGYHYIIDPSGRVWEGRPTAYQGAHVRFNNENNLGIMVMGNFEEQTPTREALASLDSFVASQMRRFRVSLSRVYTHREIGPTACPGRSLQTYMVAARGRGGRIATAMA